jgi:hypothetical protein
MRGCFGSVTFCAPPNSYRPGKDVDANNPNGCTSSEVEAAVGAAAGPYHWPGQANKVD